MADELGVPMADRVLEPEAFPGQSRTGSIWEHWATANNMQMLYSSTSSGSIGDFGVRVA